MQSGGREQNYWPGFVDALSNVVLTLLFVIVVFVFALATGMNRAAEQITKTAEAAAQQKIEQAAAAHNRVAEVSQLERTNAELEKRLTETEATVSDLRAQVAAKDAELKVAAIEVVEQQQKLESRHSGVEVAGDRIVISYPLSAADLDPKAAEALNKALDAFKGRVDRRKVRIRSIEGSEPFSAAQRYAYYRAVAVRNVLLARGIATAGDIKSTVHSPEGQGGGRVEIRF